MFNANLKKAIAGVTLAATLVTAPLMNMTQVRADDNVFTADGSSSMTVDADVTSAWTVKIPAVLALSQSKSGSYTYTGEYEVAAKGVISNTKAVTIVPVPEFTMTLTDDGSTIATASVTQTKTKFVNTVSDTNTQVAITANDYATTTGTVSVDFRKVGTYTGNAGFTFSLQDK